MKNVSKEIIYDFIDRQYQLSSHLFVIDPDSKRSEQKQLRTAYGNFLLLSMERLFVFCRDKHPEAYIATKSLLTAFKATDLYMSKHIEEKHVRSKIQTLRMFFLKQGECLSNFPRLGYRLDVDEDIMPEISKPFFRIAQSGYMVRRFSYSLKDKIKQLDDEDQQIIKICAEAAEKTLVSVNEYIQILNSYPELQRVFKHNDAMKSELNRISGLK